MAARKAAARTKAPRAKRGKPAAEAPATQPSPVTQETRVNPRDGNTVRPQS